MASSARVVFAAVLGLLAACSPAASPESIPLTDPPSVEPSLSLAERDILEAIRLRRLLGLRNDEAYVRELASDPGAAPSRMYGFPMTPDEDRLVEQRAADMDAVAEVVRKYGAEHADEWAGLYLETPTGSVVVAQFTGSLDVHRAELRGLLHPNARLELHQVRWTSAALKELKDRVRAEESWFDTIETRLNSLGVDVRANRLKIGIRTNRDDVVPLIAARFGGPDRVDVVFEGGIWTGGSGELIVVARDPGGRPVANLDCWIEGDDPDSDAGDGMLFSTDETGTCRFLNTAADTVTVFLRGGADGSLDWRGTARTTVLRDDRVTVNVTVTRATE